jgi:hypothetical protein
MPVLCRHKQHHGWPFCQDDCPATREDGAFVYQRVESPADLPPADARMVDVAVLDMNLRWPNLGHDSLVHAVQDAACDLQPALDEAGLKVRVLSYEVRGHHQVPEAPGGRFALYLGTGGPGHLDPRQNDGVSAGSQGIVEDPAWEAPLFRLFDAIQAGEDAALLAVCHTFGVLCRWSGVAAPSLRGPQKGGKSAGIQENLLTPEARRHPWFAQLAAELPDGRRLPVVDHRLFDLIPGGAFPAGYVPIGHEALGVGGPEGEALTMMEFARDAGGAMPRVFGANHHPEVVERARQLLVLEEKRARGEVTHEWAEDRRQVLAQTYAGDADDHRLRLTSDYTLLQPLRFHLYRQVRRRAESLGRPVSLHEEEIQNAAAGSGDR